MLRNKTLIIAAAFLLSAGVVISSAQEATREDIIAANAVKEIGNHVFYSIFDNVTVKVDKGTVLLEGKVTEPYKRKAFAQEVAEEVEGVEAVVNNIEVLPPSAGDDALRIRLAREIYNDTTLLRYGLSKWPYPIHILVQNGHVTLEGQVANDFDKRYIDKEVRAVFGVISVDNNLVVADDDAEMKNNM